MSAPRKNTSHSISKLSDIEKYLVSVLDIVLTKHYAYPLQRAEYTIISHWKRKQIFGLDWQPCYRIPALRKLLRTLRLNGYTFGEGISFQKTYGLIQCFCTIVSTLTSGEQKIYGVVRGTLTTQDTALLLSILNIPKHLITRTTDENGL